MCIRDRASWTDRRLKCVKYVDDCLAIEKVSFSGAETVAADGTETAIVRAVKTQNHFCTIEYNAELRGMQLNH